MIRVKVVRVEGRANAIRVKMVRVAGQGKCGEGMAHVIMVKVVTVEV